MNLFEGMKYRMIEMAGIKHVIKLNEEMLQKHYPKLKLHIENIIKRLETLPKLPLFLNLKNKEILYKNIKTATQALKQSIDILDLPTDPKEKIYKISEILVDTGVSFSSIQKICNLIAGNNSKEEYTAANDMTNPEQQNLVKILFTDSPAMWMKTLEDKIKEIMRDPEDWNTQSKIPKRGQPDTFFAESKN